MEGEKFSAKTPLPFLSLKSFFSGSEGDTRTLEEEGDWFAQLGRGNRKKG